MGGVRCRVGLAGHDLGAQGRVGRQYTMEENEMESGTWDEGGQALQEFQRGHHEVGGAIAVRGFELEDDLAGWCTVQAFVAQGRTRNVAAQTFEFLSLLGAAICIRMQAKALGTHTARGLRCLWTGEAQRWVFPRQHFLSRSGAKGNAVGAGRCLQRRQGGIGIGIGVGQIRDLGDFFHQCAVAREHLQQPGDDPRE